MSKLTETPIFYTGKKWDAIKCGMIDLFPDNINTFYDLFAGSCMVSYHTKAKQYVINDISLPLFNIIKMFIDCDADCLIKQFHQIISDFGLEYKKDGKSFDKRTKDFGQCSYNYHSDCYNKFRDYYNNYEKENAKFLYLLTVYSFSHQMRFNNIGNFNMPVGPGKWSSDIEFRIQQFMSWLDKNKIRLYNQDYFSFLTNITNQDFVYLDPPYYGTVATYNENGAWTLDDDMRLFDFCDRLTKKNIKWAMSNVLVSDKSKKEHLINWVNVRGYKLHFLDGVKYASCCDDLENKSRQEILIINY